MKKSFLKDGLNNAWMMLGEYVCMYVCMCAYMDEEEFLKQWIEQRMDDVG